MKAQWKIPVWDWRDHLDELGVWPSDLPGKAVCAGAATLMVCLVAHYHPFSIDALIAALMAYGVFIVLLLFVFGVATGITAALMGIYFDLRGEPEAPVARSKDGQEQGAPLDHPDTPAALTQIN